MAIPFSFSQHYCVICGSVAHPEALQDQGGWENRETAYRFVAGEVHEVGPSV
jgi:hypothetical protein